MNKIYPRFFCNINDCSSYWRMESNEKGTFYNLKDKSSYKSIFTVEQLKTFPHIKEVIKEEISLII